MGAMSGKHKIKRGSYRRPGEPADRAERHKYRANHFHSTLGLVLSCLGCVVGTGNIWRFPRMVANHSTDEGGGVFLVVWFIFLWLWSIPMLIIEYGTGRYTQFSVLKSFRKFVGIRWTWMGAWICCVSFFIGCYYSVVVGWCFYYLYYSVVHELPTEPDESRKIFADFAENSYWPMLTTAIAVVGAGLCVIKGVKTLEKVSMFLVPMQLVLILFNLFWSLTREYADIGISYLFKFNLKTFAEPRVWIDALSQNAFDTGAGTGVFIPYSSFMTRSHGIVRYSVTIPMLNNLVSLTCGITIFAAVFSTLIPLRPTFTSADVLSVLKDSGPGSTGLTFIWMPVLYQTVGGFGRVLCILFFLCLSFAGLTSLISYIELCAHTLTDWKLHGKKIPRHYAVLFIVICTYLIGLLSATNVNILTNQDFVWGFALIINGLLLIAMVIYYRTSTFRQIVVNEFGVDDWKLSQAWEWVVKYVGPLEGLALIVWWGYDSMRVQMENGLEWYTFGRESFMSTIVQWLGLMSLLFVINMVVVYYCIRRPPACLSPETVEHDLEDTSRPKRRHRSPPEAEEEI